MRTTAALGVLACLVMLSVAQAAEPQVVFSGQRKQNNLVTLLLEATAVSEPESTLTFRRERAGWVFVSAECRGPGAVALSLDDAPLTEGANLDSATSRTVEAFREVTAGDHRLTAKYSGGAVVDRVIVRAVPELIHCGLGFNPAIKGYGAYDLEFLKKDILPNITTTIVPSNIVLEPPSIDDWHRQGKKFVAEVGINAQAATAEEHVKAWMSVLEKSPWLDGIIVNEFIVNAPSNRLPSELSPDRRERLIAEQGKYKVYEAAIRLLKADERFRGKMLYAYVGGSGKTLNQEVVGPTFIPTIVECGYRVALERYLFEVSSEQKSQDALKLFVDGIADWSAKAPGVKEQMVIAFGLFSMPPGGINKQPNVDYHVWMDQQMNVVANNPPLAGIGGLEWWTTILADEETTRFVGKLYRHYGIEGRTDMLTRDPLFLTHLNNADFERGTESWTLTPAEPESIQPKSFPRYGRIEGRYMGLGRPADPEHIGDTFLWMKRSEKRANKFSQTIRDLTPGRLYSLKMFSCDYRDLTEPKAKKVEEAQPFVGQVMLDGVELDQNRSFTEMYPSSPEPPIPIWITYHWKVFRAAGTTATLTVTDWPAKQAAAGPFGQEQTFNFLELQPYHE